MIRLWVKDEDCYLTNGELAFVNERIAKPLPSWFEEPTESAICRLNDGRDVALERWETRCMRGAAEDVVSYYKDRVSLGGLSVLVEVFAPEVPGRYCPGFSAENAQDRFSVDVYQWQDLAFWTARLSHPDRKPKARYGYLRVVRHTSTRIILGINEGTLECWAPTNAVTEVSPIDPQEYIRRWRRHREPEQMPWSGLPVWLQFVIPGRIPSLVAFGDPGEWVARTVLSSTIDPYSAFNACLGLLDSHGFDPTGDRRKDRTYFLQVWLRGQIVQASIRSKSEGEAILCLNASEKSISLRYAEFGGVLAYWEL